MRWVPAAGAYPSRCAVLPQIGTHHPLGFFDSENLVGPSQARVYVSVLAVREMATRLGWRPPGDVLNLRAELAGVQGELEAARREVEELRRKFDAIDVLASEGFTARRKPGRPAKVEV